MVADWFAMDACRTAPPCRRPTSRSGADGLALQLNAPNSSGGLVSTNPDDGAAGHTGFQIAPTPGKPVYVEFKVTLPATPAGTVANWPGVWLDGQTWPEDGEIDVMEGGWGSTAYHIHYGSGSSTAQGGTANDSRPGTHTYGVLWTTTGVTFLYDGAVVGTLTEVDDQPDVLGHGELLQQRRPHRVPRHHGRALRAGVELTGLSRATGDASSEERRRDSSEP